MSGPGFLELLIYVVPLFMVTFIVFIALRSRVNRIEQRAAVQKAVIEKFASAQELVEFMKTPEGQQLLKDPARRISPWHQVLTPAIILLFIGGVMCVIPGKMWIPGALIAAAGLSLVVIAFVRRSLRDDRD